MSVWGTCNGADVVLDASWAANETEPVWAVVVDPPHEPSAGGLMWTYEVVGELPKHGWIVRLSKSYLELAALDSVAFGARVIYIVRAPTAGEAIRKLPLDDVI